jgi:hypothetical protein
LGPNRPVSGGEETPSQPGENGTSVFNSALDQSMDAPDENEMPDETEGDLELDNLDEPEETDLEDESEDVPEPEAGANPKKEKVEESRKFKGLKGFSQFINESDYDPYSEDYEEYPEDYDEYGLDPSLDPRFDDPRYDDPRYDDPRYDDPYSEDYDEYDPDPRVDAPRIPDDMPAYKTRWRQPEEDDYDFGMNPDSEIEGYFPDDFCPNCGEELGYTPEGTSCGCNM